MNSRSLITFLSLYIYIWKRKTVFLLLITPNEGVNDELFDFDIGFLRVRNSLHHWNWRCQTVYRFIYYFYRIREQSKRHFCLGYNLYSFHSALCWFGLKWILLPEWSEKHSLRQLKVWLRALRNAFFQTELLIRCGNKGVSKSRTIPLYCVQFKFRNESLFDFQWTFENVNFWMHTVNKSHHRISILQLMMKIETE